MHASPGVYALLLGSGVSRSAGIPTGWEVVEDLIRMVAALEEQSCEPDPAAWYTRKYGQPPNYAELINSIAKSATERSQLLRGYFEPTDEEREQGIKVPTPAHHAIARLISDGFVRIIITTNFDRLMEQALEGAGVIPMVVSTPDAVEGVLPLMHSKCTVLKVHGDYLDTRIKNSPAELANYDQRVGDLLDRLLDECGLLVCGWSAEWDTALREATERCKSRRFTTYWAMRGEPGDAAKQLIAFRRAQVIETEGADHFFPELAEKVGALQDLDRPHPLSAKVAVAQAKKYLAEHKYRIQLHDLLMQEVERIVEEAAPRNYPVTESFKNEDIVKRIAAFEALSETAIGIISIGCYWGDREHRPLWVSAVDRLANPSRPQAWNNTLQGLRVYPAMLLLYAGGIAAISGNHYEALYDLLSKPKVRDNRGPVDLVIGLSDGLKPEVFKAIPDLKDKKVPRSERLFQVLREPLREILPDDEGYERAFDCFEAMQSFWSADTIGWAMPGAFMYRHDRDEKGSVLAEIVDEHKAQGNNWHLFKIGFFQGKPERWEPALKEVLKMTKHIIFR